MSIEKHIINIDVYDFEKLYRPSKVYVYYILVSWSDDSKYIVYRDYTNFTELQSKLSGIYTKERKVNQLTQKDIPELPEKILFGRNNVKSVALKRLDILDKYCKKLITLQKEISQCEHVIKFFESNSSDVEKSLKMHLDKKDEKRRKSNSSNENLIPVSMPKTKHEYKVIHDFKGSNKSELTVSKGAHVLVLEKNLNGWWFVETMGSIVNSKGFVPSSFLEIVKNNSDETDSFKTDIPEPHIVTNDYQARNNDEISVKKANYVLVIEKNLNGFWKVKLGNLIGLVPAVFLIPNVSLINKIRSTMLLVDASILHRNDQTNKIIGKDKVLIDKNQKNGSIVEKYQTFLQNTNRINTILKNPIFKHEENEEKKTTTNLLTNNNKVIRISKVATSVKIN